MSKIDTIRIDHDQVDKLLCDAFDPVVSQDVRYGIIKTLFVLELVSFVTYEAALKQIEVGL